MVAQLRAPSESFAKLTLPKVPKNLIREVIDGVPFYYLGYRDVMNGTKTFEEIMSDSGLQFFIKMYLNDLFSEGLDRKKYRFGAGELGFHQSLRNNMGFDVVVYDREVLTPAMISPKFVKVAPKLLIEVDVNVEMSDPTADIFENYVARKVKKVFAYGTEKVVWIFTKSRKVLVWERGSDCQFLDWNSEIELLDGVKMNVGEYIQNEGFNLDLKF